VILKELPVICKIAAREEGEAEGDLLTAAGRVDNHEIERNDTGQSNDRKEDIK
jgi:hypothetical protein